MRLQLVDMLILKEVGQSLNFLFSVSLTFVVLMCGFILALEWPQFQLAFVHKHIAEALAFVAMAWLFYARFKPARLITFLLLLLLVVVYYVQINSLEFAGGYLPSVALENAQHVDFLLDPTKIAWGIIIFSAFVTCFVFAMKTVGEAPRLRARVLSALLFLLCSVVLKNDKDWVAASTLNDRFQFYNSGVAGIEYVTPLSAMSDTLDEYYQAMIREKFIDQASVELSAEAAVFAYDFGYRLNGIDPNFPLLRDIEFDAPPPSVPKKSWEPLNVIVFFVEGMSARIIQPYSDNFPGISPNIEKFSESALVVDNYFSHSYATYRGLSGQFCSIFANGRLLDETNYRCLPHVLNENGYETHFLFSQSKERTNLDEVGAIAGYTDVHGQEELLALFPEAEDVGNGAKGIISDRSFIEAFNRWLESRKSSDKPFFAALYNFETHTGVHLKPGFNYTDPTGKASSYVLDTFHNFDAAFKSFMDYFEKSPYAENTIVVVTSDHGTYGSKDFFDLVRHNKDYAPVFVDRIPLIVKHPQGEYARFDANKATSLHFAPSLLNILNIEAEGVPFLGRSIFDQETRFPKPLTAGKNVTRINIHPGYWFRQQLGFDIEVPKHAKHAKQHHELVLYTQSLERENRLAPPP